jgi:hypothetical protein
MPPDYDRAVAAGDDNYYEGVYEEISQFLAERERREDAFGQGEIALDWARAHLHEDDVEYFVQGLAWAADHPKGYGWEERVRRPHIERLVGAFNRAWIERYGNAASWRRDQAG